jgi:arylsulfatase A-like enzyme
MTAIAAIALGLLSACGLIEAQRAPSSRPNLILIITDDLDVGSIAFMPRLKTLLADQGQTFANFFVTDPVCCPSRASILLGQYPHNHQVLTNQPPRGGFPRFRDLGHERSTIATWLKGAGYRTALFGKYLNRYPAQDQERTYVPPGWDEWGALISGNYVYYRLNENGRIVRYGFSPEDYETDVLARKATAFIRQTAGRQPFFIYLAPSAPHDSLVERIPVAAPRHERLFEEMTSPRTPSFNEADVSDKPQYVRRWPLLSPWGMSQQDELYRHRLRSLQAVDEMLTRLVVALTETGELERTYIFFTSDNGFHLGQHRLPKGKMTPYEEDIRVPLIVRGPGVPRGGVVEHVALNIDLAPTLAELAGLLPPKSVDGRSLAALLTGHQPAIEDWRQAFLVESWEQPPIEIPGYQALRTREFLYVEYGTEERELYNLRTDPWELESLHASADPALLTRLTSVLETLRRCAGASCRAAERALPTGAEP